MSETLTVLEINCETGEAIEREMTPEEISQREIDMAAAAAEEAERIAQEEAKNAARQSAIAKLTELGLTEEEALAIIGQ